MSFTLLTTIVLTALHYFESAVVDQNSCCYSFMKFINFCEGEIFFTMESVYISIVISLRVSFSDFLF